MLAATRQGLWRAPIGLRLTIFEPKFNFRKSLFVGQLVDPTRALPYAYKGFLPFSPQNMFIKHCATQHTIIMRECFHIDKHAFGNLGGF